MFLLRSSSVFLALAACVLTTPLRAAPRAPSPAPRSPVAAICTSTAGFQWFRGSFEEAVAKAKEEKKLLFVDFWASWCTWCKRFDAEVLSDPTVRAELEGFVCLSVDAESEKGQPIAARYGIAGLPGLVFLEPDGSLRDRMAGYRSSQQFLIEIGRVRANLQTLGEVERRLRDDPNDVLARLELVIRLRRIHDGKWKRELDFARGLVASGQGFDADDPDVRFEIGRKLRMCGDLAGYQEQLAKVRALDPEGRSAARRRLQMDEKFSALNARFRKDGVFDPEDLITFLREEQHPDVRFEGWSMLQDVAWEQWQQLERRGNLSAALENLIRAKEWGRTAWKDCPEERVANFGRSLAASFLSDPRLTEEEVRFAVEVATKAAEAAPRGADQQEVLASCLERAGREDEAVAALRRALELDPGRPSVASRLRDRATERER